MSQHCCEERCCEVTHVERLVQHNTLLQSIILTVVLSLSSLSGSYWCLFPSLALAQPQLEILDFESKLLLWASLAFSLILGMVRPSALYSQWPWWTWGLVPMKPMALSFGCILESPGECLQILIVHLMKISGSRRQASIFFKTPQETPISRQHGEPMLEVCFSCTGAAAPLGA